MSALRTQEITRRSALALGAGLATAPLLGPLAHAAGPATPAAGSANFVYDLQPVSVADGVWVVPGVQEKITAKNGGAIANVVIMDTRDGAVIVDTGPSHRYGVELVALSQKLTNKPVARVFITHIHSDHMLGATAFDPTVLFAPDGLAADIKYRGNDIAQAMYRVAGDWMRGTNVPEPSKVANNGFEQIGERKLHCLTLSGHTATDLCIYDDRSGLLVSGDIVFLDRAPTTPDANLSAWRTSLAKLADIPHAKLIPGHGPVEAGRRGIDQTHRWLDFVDDAIGKHFGEGLDETEMMATSIPGWTDDIAVARYEYQRSVMHLLPRLESSRLPLVGA